LEGIRKGFLAAVAFLTLAGALGCYPVLKKEAQYPEEALRQVRFFSLTFRDDMDLDSLTLTIRRNLEYLDRLNPGTVFHYGPHDFTLQQVRESQEAFLDLLSKGLDAGQLNREIRKKFRVYRATGREGDASVLFTGYYEPMYEGSLTRDETFRYPSTGHLMICENRFVPVQ
jgi:membrane-bound lytic murein transglycosylase A